MKTYMLLLLLIIGLLSCNKDKYNIENCFLSDKYNDITYISTHPFYTIYGFNPSNVNEILCNIETDTGNFVYKANLQTRTKESLMHKQVFITPKWGTNNKVIFTASDANIWVINSNGDSLVQLTSGGGAFYPNWLPNSNEAIYVNINKRPSPVIKKNIYSELNASADSLCNTPGIITLSTNGKWITASNGTGLTIVNIENTAETVKIENLTTEHKPINDYMISWDNSSENVFWTDAESVFKTNIYSHETKTILQGCKSKLFRNPICSPDNRLIYLKEEKTVNNNKLFIKDEFYISNMDGTDEKLISIF